MDQYGIGEAMLQLLQYDEQMVRGTGRTTAMMTAATDKSVLVFDSHRELDRVKRELQFYNKRPTLINLSVYDNMEVALRGYRGDVILDHEVVRKCYLRAVAHAASSFMELPILQVDTNPYGQQNGSRIFKREMHDYWWRD